MATEKVSLWVNKGSIPVDAFTQKFVEHVLVGILATLKGTGEIQNLKLFVEGEDIQINLNGTIVPLTPFVGKFIKNTVIGMVSSLKGVGKIDNLQINITK